jgi:hypothetical protein
MLLFNLFYIFQVPLPFVVDQDSTFTVNDDDDVQIKGTGKGDLRKRQFTMHLFCNAGRGEDCGGYTVLIGRGQVLKGTRFSEAERASWSKNVPFLFQKNAWVDTKVMEDIARGFVDYVKEKHKGKRVLVFCDNLSSHLADSVKKIFREGNVVLCFLPADLTEAVQPIDAGYGRSVRCCIGNLLDSWLMEDENMDRWESGMKPAERRILISTFVDLATTMTLKKDDMRIGCFTRTGCLMTADGSDDDQIRPQALTKKVIIDKRCLSSQEIIDFFGGETMDDVSNETVEEGLTRDDTEIHLTLQAGEINDATDYVIDEDDDEDDIEDQQVFNSTMEILDSIPPATTTTTTTATATSIPHPPTPPPPPPPPPPPELLNSNNNNNNSDNESDMDSDDTVELLRNFPTKKISPSPAPAPAPALPTPPAPPTPPTPPTPPPTGATSTATATATSTATATATATSTATSTANNNINVNYNPVYVEVTKGKSQNTAKIIDGDILEKLRTNGFDVSKLEQQSKIHIEWLNGLKDECIISEMKISTHGTDTVGRTRRKRKR